MTSGRLPTLDSITTAAADFRRARIELPRLAPPFGQALLTGTLHISPNKGTQTSAFDGRIDEMSPRIVRCLIRELSLHKLAIYPGVCRKRFRCPRAAHLRVSLGLNDVSVRSLAALA
jgi:hypothetical protein